MKYPVSFLSRFHPFFMNYKTFILELALLTFLTYVNDLLYEICWNDTFDVKKLLTSCEFDMNQSQKQLTPYFFSYVVIDKSFFLSTTYNESKFLNIVLWKYLMLSLLFSFGLLSWNPTTLNTSFNNKNLAKKLKTSFLLPTITQGDLTHILFKSLPKFWILLINPLHRLKPNT